MQKNRAASWLPEGDRVIPDFEITPGEGGRSSGGYAEKAMPATGIISRDRASAAARAMAIMRTTLFCFNQSTSKRKNITNHSNAVYIRHVQNSVETVHKWGISRDFCRLRQNYAAKKGGHFCGENEKEQANHRPCFAAWALMRSQLSSLKSCSIRQASARAFSGETPSACSRAVRTRWRS